MKTRMEGPICNYASLTPFLAAYLVEPLGNDLSPVALKSPEKTSTAIFSELDDLEVYNVTTASENRNVELSWGGSVSKFVPRQIDPVPIQFSPASGFSFEILRAYSANESAIGCSTFIESDYSLLATTYTSSFTDANFNPNDENPIVAYKVRISYKGTVALAMTNCAWTHVSHCYERPNIASE